MQNIGCGVLLLVSIRLSYKSSQWQRVFQKPVELSKLQDRPEFGLSSRLLFRKSGLDYNCPFYCLAKRSFLQLFMQSCKGCHDAFLPLFLQEEGYLGGWKCPCPCCPTVGPWLEEQDAQDGEGRKEAGAKQIVSDLLPGMQMLLRLTRYSGVMPRSESHLFCR